MRLTGFYKSTTGGEHVRCILSAGIIVGERPYLTTKIITLSEFFNFVHQVSRL
jgi:hypothetical protein